MNTNTILLTSEKAALKNYLRDTTLHADQLIKIFMLGFFCLGVFVAPIYNTWNLALIVGSGITVLFFMCTQLWQTKLISKCINSILFACFSALFIAQMHGSYMMHFFFFVCSAVLIIYQDWRVIATYAASVAAYYGIFFALIQKGVDIDHYFIRMDEANIGLHIFLTLLMTIICGWWAIILHNRSLVDFQNKQQLLLQQKSVNRIKTFAEEISTGKIQTTLELDESDELGKSLINMQTSLLQAKAKEDAEHYKTKGLTDLGIVMRKHSENTEELSNAVISKLVMYTGSMTGNIYLQENIDSEGRLKLSGAFAHSGENQKKSFAQGEGLVGQVMLEGKTIHLTKIPEGYLNISSGMGNTRPKSLLIIPIQYEGKAVGVIEIASLKALEEHHIEFIEKASEDLAIFLVSSLNNKRAEHLLDAYKKQAEAMQSQEEKLYVNLEELSYTQSQMEKREQEQNAEILRLKKELEELKKIKVVN